MEAEGGGPGETGVDGGELEGETAGTKTQRKTGAASPGRSSSCSQGQGSEIGDYRVKKIFD